jgi:hypothetical protein
MDKIRQVHRVVDCGKFIIAGVVVITIGVVVIIVIITIIIHSLSLTRTHKHFFVLYLFNGILKKKE